MWYQTAPVVALTALAMPGDRERSQAVGMQGYLVKPVNMQMLGETLSAFRSRPNGAEGSRDELTTPCA